MPQAPKYKSQWLCPEQVPRELSTEDFVLEPLHARHAEVDFAAFMSCRERLRVELQWGDWPPADFTLPANRKDLAEHYAEFESGAAFAFTVLSTDRSSCLGCIYIERTDAESESVAQLAFWMTDADLQYEEFLLKTVLEWMHSDWGFQQVVVPLRPENQRCIAIAQRLHLEAAIPVSESLKAHHCFVSRTT